MCLALGRHFRRKMIGAGFICEGFGGSFPPAPPEEDAPEDGAEPPAKEPLWEQVASQLSTAATVAMSQAGHPHALIRETLLELTLLHGRDDPRAGAAMLTSAASLVDLSLIHI